MWIKIQMLDQSMKAQTIGTKKSPQFKILAKIIFGNIFLSY